MTPAKYKAKDLKGRWVFGTPIETKPSLNVGFHKWWIIESAFSHGGYFYIGQRKSIKEETLCVKTSLKDINSKEIYTNDILTDNVGRKYIVVKDNNPKECITVETETNKTMPLDMSDILSREFRIVGNKFDNN